MGCAGQGKHSNVFIQREGNPNGDRVSQMYENQLCCLLVSKGLVEVCKIGWCFIFTPQKATGTYFKFAYTQNEILLHAPLIILQNANVCIVNMINP